MSISIQLYILLEKTSSFFGFFKFATESKKYLGERFDAYSAPNFRYFTCLLDKGHIILGISRPLGFPF